ncbi:MAG: D-alanyl-D-alanine carboxypeptidase [Alphaproteobacteria bacterium]|nr:D-alanyl-D-alanine carboxypeptidase [Alphaproteobacteria bacterium]
MMKKLLFILPVLFICNFAYGASYRAALVADMESGRVLYSENANVANYPASLTKIMTLYLTFNALEHGRLHLDDYLIVSNAAANAEPVKLGLPAGSKIKVEDAIKAVAVHSANDVARVLAENLKGGKEGNFASLMTQVATEIGLSNTNFENSSGLPDDDHLSTARDIALLSVAVYKHFPQYWKYFGIKSWTYNGQTYTNGNRLLSSYPGCDGMKTGFTNKSKYSLVATASRDGRHLIAVVLGADDKDIRASVATSLLNRGFKMLENGTEPVVFNSAPTPTPAVPKQNYNAAPINENNPLAKYTINQSKNNNMASGASGVQFGAFSSRDAALRQVKNVEHTLGVHASIEPASGGLFRVRVNNISESVAQSLRNSATAAGIDSFVFH